MRKKLAAGILCVLMALQMALPPAAKAGESIYFLAVSNEVQPLSDQTMPFWSEGYLYVPTTVFTGSARKSLGVLYTFAERDQIALFYNERQRLLAFSLKEGYAVDQDNNIWFPGAIQRNGVLFVPIGLVANGFGLEYSVTDVSRGQLIWIRQRGFGLTSQQFADAAAYQMASRYAAYLREKEAAAAPTPEMPEEMVDEEEMVIGKRLYLCMKAGQQTEALLNELDRYHVQAAFFCTPEFLKQEGDLLRRMTATGQSIGILADGDDPHRSVVEQLEEGNQALEAATCGRTRLARIRNGEEAELRAAQDAGYRCLVPDLDRSGYDLRSAAGAEKLLRSVSGRRGSVSVWLSDRVSVSGLQALLKTAESAAGQCLAWTETA